MTAMGRKQRDLPEMHPTSTSGTKGNATNTQRDRVIMFERSGSDLPILTSRSVDARNVSVRLRIEG